MNSTTPDVDELAQAAVVEDVTPAAADQAPSAKDLVDPSGASAVEPAVADAGPVDEEEDPRALAQAAWRADPTLTGAQLADRYGKSERWGRQQIAAAKSNNGNSRAGQGAAAGGGMPDRQRSERAGNPPAARQRQPAGNRQPQTPRRAAGRQQEPVPSVPPLLVAVTVAAVGVVTVVCAVVSYTHVRDLAESVGMGSLARWLPAGVDGLVVASSCSLIVDRRQGRPIEPLAVVGIVLGLAGSLAANVLAVDPELVSLRAVRWVLAGYAPFALAVSGHLLLRMLGQHQQPQ